MKAHTKTSAALIALLLNGAALRADPTITATPKQPCVELGADPPSASFKAACTPVSGSMPTDLCCSAEDQPVNWENFNFQWEWAGDPRVAGGWHSETADVDLSGITAPTTITANVKAKSQWRCVRAASPNPRAVNEPGNPSDSMNVKVDDLEVPEITISNGTVGLGNRSVTNMKGEQLDSTGNLHWFYSGTLSNVRADELYNAIGAPTPEPCNDRADAQPPSSVAETTEVGASLYFASISWSPWQSSTSPFQESKVADKRYYVQWFSRSIVPTECHFEGTRVKKRYNPSNGTWVQEGAPENVSQQKSLLGEKNINDKHAKGALKYCCWQ